MSATNYVFTSANKGDVTVSISGHYVDGCVDVDVDVDGVDYRVFDEIDAGGVDDIIEWLISIGVEFESMRSMWFNAHYISAVMIDHDATEPQLLDEAANLTDEKLEQWRKWYYND